MEGWLFSSPLPLSCLDRMAADRLFLQFVTFFGSRSRDCLLIVDWSNSLGAVQCQDDRLKHIFNGLKKCKNNFELLFRKSFDTFSEATLITL